MAQIELRLTPEPGSETLDQNYARRLMQAGYAALPREQAASGQGPETRGVPGQGTEDVPTPAPAAAPPAEPAAAPPPAETPALPPSAIMGGIQTPLRPARDGILLAVRPGPLSVASAKEVFDGLLQTVLAPLAGAAAGLGQLAENTP